MIVMSSMKELKIKRIEVQYCYGNLIGTQSRHIYNQTLQLKPRDPSSQQSCIQKKEEDSVVGKKRLQSFTKRPRPAFTPTHSLIDLNKKKERGGIEPPVQKRYSSSVPRKGDMLRVSRKQYEKRKEISFLCYVQWDKSMEQRLNLSRSQDKAYSHAYNTPFLI